MIFYTTQSLEKPQILNQIAPSTAGGLNLQNNSPWSFAFRTDTAHYEILPFSFSSIPLNSGQAWSLEPESSTTYLPQSGLNIQVSGSYSTNVVTSFSTNSSLPIYTVPISGNVTVGNTITTNTTITNNPTVNINASGNTVTVGNTITTNTNITNNPTVNISSSGNTVTVGNTVNVNATVSNKPTVNINASGNTVTVGNTVNTNTTITNNPTVNINSSGNTVQVAGVVDNNVTNVNLPVNQMIKIGANENVGIDLAAGSSVNITITSSSTPLTLCEEIYVGISGNTTNLTYTLNTISNNKVNNWYYVVNNAGGLIIAQSDNFRLHKYNLIELAKGSMPLNEISMNVKNNGTTTITSTLSFYAYGRFTGLMENTKLIKVFASSIGSTATNSLFKVPNNIYRLTLWTNGPGVCRLQLSGGAWLAFFMNSVMNIDMPLGYGCAGQTLELYNTDTSTQYYTVICQYD